MASHENIGGYLKSWRLMEILAGTQKIGVWQKYRRTIESWQALKSPRLAKISAEKFCARLLFGLGGIPTADFLLGWLKSSRSDPHRCAASQTCRPQVRSQLKPLCFYGRRLSRTVPAGCTAPTCQNIRGCPNSWRPHKFSPIPVKTQKFYLGS